MRIALVHDWLTGMRGGEKCLEVFCDLLPEADIFTLVHIPGSVSPAIERHRIFTSYLQNMPFGQSRYRHYLPWMPHAVSRFDLNGYDRIISLSHCAAKGVRVPRPEHHACFCFTPMRYIWDQFPYYFGPGQSSFAARAAMRLLRGSLQRWDVKSSRGVGHFIAISKFVGERIRRYYGRNSEVIYPPVDTDFFIPGEDAGVPEEPFYLIASALAPYKRVDLAVEAFNRNGRRLKIIGTGPEAASLKKRAAANIEFLGWQDDEALRRHYRACRALIFPGVEDFGIVPLEAMACGRPVIARGEGGALETVAAGETGIFFSESTAGSLEAAIDAAEKINWDAGAIRRRAERFDTARFRENLKEFLANRLQIRL